MIKDDFRTFANGAMNSDDAPETVAPNDTIASWNVRNGTKSGEDNYKTNLESTINVSAGLPNGICKAIGSQAFEQIRAGISFIYNSQGNDSIRLISADSNTEQIIYTDLTDSAGENLMPLNPKFYVNDIKLVQGTYLLWTDSNDAPHFTNLTKLRNGDYGTVLEEDFSLIKPPPLVPITAEYGNDPGRAANFLSQKLGQYLYQYIDFEDCYSAWSTRSKRIVPEEESTPSVGTDVSQNNYEIISLPIGSIRVKTIVIGTHFDDLLFYEIKRVDTSYILALPNTAVDVSSQIYEGYNPSTGIYQFAFYNDNLSIPIDIKETDLIADNVPLKAGAMEIINGNQVALGDIMEGYPRPATDISLSVAGYDPNIGVPANQLTDRMRITYQNTTYRAAGTSNSRSDLQVNFLGTPVTGDTITIVVGDNLDANYSQSYSYTVLSGDGGDLLTVISHFAATIPNASYRVDTASPQIILTVSINNHFFDNSYFLKSANITLFNPGATASKSIEALLDDSTYQPVLLHYDKYGRKFPIQLGDVQRTLSFAQYGGLTPQINWQINNAIAPDGAASYQWGMTKNSSIIQGAMLDVMGAILSYKGQWDAATNTTVIGSIHLAAGTGTVGDTYQVSVPNGNATTYNLGNGTGVNYPSGWYVVYNGQSWDLLDKDFADLTTSSNVMAVKINPLALFNQLYANQGTSTVLTYDFSQGDRCTFHYYISSGNQYFNNPCVNVQILGYDVSTNILKMEKSAAFTYAAPHVSYGGTQIDGLDLFVRLYSPNTQKTSADDILLTTEYREIGEQFPIVNGLYTQLTGQITEGGVYFKSRQYQGAIDPNTSYSVLATDFNFSDFYFSQYYSFGRVRTFFDTPETTEKQASIRYSQPYILGSKINGLTRWYDADIYGESGGQSTSNYGRIEKMVQRNNFFVILQTLKEGYIPVYIQEVQDNKGTSTYAISDQIFGNIRYSNVGNIGLGGAKESVSVYGNFIRYADINRSEPIQSDDGGVRTISDKLNKFFKATLQAAYALGNKIISFYDAYNEEWILSAQQPGDRILTAPYTPANWAVLEPYTITTGQVVAVNAPTHGSNSYNAGTGVDTYTPALNYTGNDTFTFTFNPGTGNITKNACGVITAGDFTPNLFSFAPQTNQPLSTLIYSNFVQIMGINQTVPVTITGGEYSKNGGSWTSSAGTAVNGDTFQVRQTSSASTSTLTTATLTVGGVSAPFNVTTRAASGTTLYAANNVTPNSKLTVNIDDGLGHTYTILNVNPMANSTVAIVAGAYTVQVQYVSKSGSPTATVVVNGTSYSLTSGIIFTVPGTVTAPITVILNH